MCLLTLWFDASSSAGSVEINHSTKLFVTNHHQCQCTDKSCVLTGTIKFNNFKSILPGFDQCSISINSNKKYATIDICVYILVLMLQVQEVELK